MTDKPFDPVTDGTPGDFLRLIEPDWEDKWAVAHILEERDNAMRRKGEIDGRRKGLLEAAEIVDDLDVPLEKSWWNYTDGFKDGRHMAEQAIRTAAEKISDPLQVEERCNGKEEE